MGQSQAKEEVDQNENQKEVVQNQATKEICEKRGMKYDEIKNECVQIHTRNVLKNGVLNKIRMTEKVPKNELEELYEILLKYILICEQRKYIDVTVFKKNKWIAALISSYNFTVFLLNTWYKTNYNSYNDYACFNRAFEIVDKHNQCIILQTEKTAVELYYHCLTLIIPLICGGLQDYGLEPLDASQSLLNSKGDCMFIKLFSDGQLLPRLNNADAQYAKYTQYCYGS